MRVGDVDNTLFPPADLADSADFFQKKIHQSICGICEICGRKPNHGMIRPTT